jgi:hypothetical protein
MLRLLNALYDVYAVIPCYTGLPWLLADPVSLLYPQSAVSSCCWTGCLRLFEHVSGEIRKAFVGLMTSGVSPSCGKWQALCPVL